MEVDSRLNGDGIPGGMNLIGLIHRVVGPHTDTGNFVCLEMSSIMELPNQLAQIFFFHVRLVQKRQGLYKSSLLGPSGI